MIGEGADANCPMARSVDLIGEWGSLLILREAFGGVRRFDDFQKRIGISRNLLTTRLKKLVDGGVLERRPVHSDAKRYEYVLTEMGEDLFATIIALRQWGDRWLFPKGNYPADMFDGRDQSPVAHIEAGNNPFCQHAICSPASAIHEAAASGVAPGRDLERIY